MLHMHIYIYIRLSPTTGLKQKKVTHGVFPAQTNLQQEMQTSDAKCIGADAQHTNACSHHPTASPHHVWWTHCETGKRRGPRHVWQQGRGKGACTAQQQVLRSVVGELLFWVPDLVAVHHPNQQIHHVYRFCLLSQSKHRHPRKIYQEPLICLSLFGWLGLDLYMNQ
jgi:hypothetical protein